MFDPIVEPICPLGETTVTITRTWGDITITLVSDSDHDYNMADVIGALVRPALLALGYDQLLVNKYVEEVY